MIHCCRKYGFLLALLLATHVCKAQIIARFTLLFPFDKFEIDANNSKVLDSAYASWKINPQKIQLFGHTDAIGNDPYNDALSIKRVAAAKHYFLSKGLALSNIIADSGLGKRRPLNNNAGPRERQLNRRVEVVLLKPEQTLIEKIYDTAIKNGSHIILKNLHFIGNRHALMPQSWPVMLELLQVMRKYKTLIIEIEGHVCCTGGKEGYDEDAKALMLSTNRAFYVYKYLIDNGIETRRLSWKAYGNSRPLYPLEETQEKRMLNRRVEIKIVKK